jgi:hypothetical protein
MNTNFHQKLPIAVIFAAFVVSAAPGQTTPDAVAQEKACETVKKSSDKKLSSGSEMEESAWGVRMAKSLDVGCEEKRDAFAVRPEGCGFRLVFVPLFPLK